MKKNTAAFILTAVIFSIILQAIFAFYFIGTTGLDRFIYIRKIVEKNTRFSFSTVDSFMDFKKSKGTAILAMPSCDLNRTLLADSFDFFVMHTDHDTSIFSIYPSAASARKHSSLYMKNVKQLEYNYSGGLFGFKCMVNGRLYGRNFFITPACRLLPSEIDVF